MAPQYASKLIYGNEVSDWQERLNTDRMRRDRAERAKRIMREHGIPALLEANSANIRYLTGLKGFNYPMCRYTLFFADHDPVMYEHSGHFHQMPDQAPWITEWRPARAWLTAACGIEAARDEARQFAADIHEELKSRGLLNEMIGFSAFDGIAREALTNAGVRNLVDFSLVMKEIRKIKTPDEIDCLKTAAAIVEGVWYSIWENAKPGVRDTELSGVATKAGYDMGAESAPPGGWRSGPSTFDRGFHQSSRLLQTGDLLYGSLCGLTYQGYATCTYRTFIVGRKPNAREQDWYKRVKDSVDGVIDAIKPGATTADAARHFPPASSWGYKEECEVLASEIGHGIGLTQGSTNYDIPIINRQWSLNYPQVFEEGMTIAIESREGETRVGGVRLENMVVVTRDGAEIMDHFPREEILVAPR